MRYFRKYDRSQHQFRKELAYALIYNESVVREEGDGDEEPMNLRSANVHRKVTMPQFSDWTDGGWKKKYKVRHQQKFCSVKGCKKKTRVMCSCSMGFYRCTGCFENHIREPDIVS